MRNESRFKMRNPVLQCQRQELLILRFEFQNRENDSGKCSCGNALMSRYEVDMYHIKHLTKVHVERLCGKV